MRGRCFCDIKQLCDDFCISETFFRDNFEKDERMRSIRRKKGQRLVLWPKDKAWEYMTIILDELCEEENG